MCIYTYTHIRTLCWQVTIDQERRWREAVKELEDDWATFRELQGKLHADLIIDPIQDLEPARAYSDEKPSDFNAGGKATSDKSKGHDNASFLADLHGDTKRDTKAKDAKGSAPQDGTGGGANKELERSESAASLIKQQLYLEQQKRQKTEDRRAHVVRMSEMVQREKVRMHAKALETKDKSVRQAYVFKKYPLSWLSIVNLRKH